MKRILLFFLMVCPLAGTAIRAELQRDAEGFYLIGTAGELVEFSAMTNDKSNDANRLLCARLTADIDLSGVANFAPIGSHMDIDLVTGMTVKDWDYRGTFDGQGHVVSNLRISNANGTEVGFFSRTIDATIRNLGIVNATVVSTSKIRAGVLAGIVLRGSVENCYTAGSLSVETEHEERGALVGSFQQNFGGSGQPMRCCFTTGEQALGNVDGALELVFEGEDVERMGPTGELCYVLNGDQRVTTWRQTLGVDALPTLDATHRVVYGNGQLLCDGSPVEGTELTYSNENTSVRPPHEFDTDGYCVVCGADAGFMQPAADGWYEVETPVQLRYISRFVNAGHPRINIRLMNDLEMGGIENFPPIGYYDDFGQQTPFQGVFDGQRHILTNLHVNPADGQEVGLFGRINGGGELKNLGIVGADVSSQQGIRAGIFAGEIHACKVSDCFSAGALSISSVRLGGDGLPTPGQMGGIAGEAIDATFTNCYTLYEKIVGGEGTKLQNSYFGEQALLDALSGALCYNLNGQTFEGATWFQTLGTDDYPTWDKTHGLVYMTEGGEYACAVTPEDYAQLVEAVVAQQTAYWENAAASRSLIQTYLQSLDALKAVSYTEFLTAYAALDGQRKALTESVQAWADYEAKVDEIKTYLTENVGYSGGEYDRLMAYLEDDVVPGEDFPHGSYTQISEIFALSTDEIKEETKFVEALFAEMLERSYPAGQDLTKLLVNADFMDKLNGWTFATGSGTVSNANNSIEHKRYVTIKQDVDMSQTVSGLKPGIYEVRLGGLTVQRNITDPQTIGQYNYGGFIYANEHQNYLQTKYSDLLGEDDIDRATELGFNTKRFSLCYDEENNELGYAPIHGIGLSFAADMGLYDNRILVNVTDSVLKIGVRNNKSLRGDNWTLLTKVSLIYQGEMENAHALEAMDGVLESMVERAAYMVEDYESDYIEYSDAPNYDRHLDAELSALMAAARTATTGAQKYELIGRFSELFGRILSCKQAYERLMAVNEEVGDVYGIYTSAEEQVKFQTEVSEKIVDLFSEGITSQADVEALTRQLLADETYVRYNGLAPELVNGVYQIAEPLNLVWFSRRVNMGFGHPDSSPEAAYRNINAALTNDIDMAGIEGFIPIGQHIDPVEGLVEGRDWDYRGTFDGQGHVIRNLSIQCSDYGEAGFFGRTCDATICNLGFENATIVSTNAIRAGVLAGIVLRGRVENVFTIGDITISTENPEKGGLAGSVLSFGNTAIVRSCFTTSETLLTVNEQFMPSLINCYAADEVARMAPTGELCYALNAGETENVAWYQTLASDPYPVLDSTHKVVFKRTEDGTFYNLEDAIQTPTANNQWPTAIYDLSGRRVQRTAKGVYIVNGKKQVVK